MLKTSFLAVCLTGVMLTAGCGAAETNMRSFELLLGAFEMPIPAGSSVAHSSENGIDLIGLSGDLTLCLFSGALDGPAGEWMERMKEAPLDDNISANLDRFEQFSVEGIGLIVVYDEEVVGSDVRVALRGAILSLLMSNHPDGCVVEITSGELE